MLECLFTIPTDAFWELFNVSRSLSTQEIACIITYLQSECIEKYLYQSQLYFKYDGEHDLMLYLGSRTLSQVKMDMLQVLK